MARGSTMYKSYTCPHCTMRWGLGSLDGVLYVRGVRMYAHRHFFSPASPFFSFFLSFHTQGASSKHTGLLLASFPFLMTSSLPFPLVLHLFTYCLVFYPVADVIAYYVYCVLTISFHRAFARDWLRCVTRNWFFCYLLLSAVRCASCSFLQGQSAYYVRRLCTCAGSVLLIVHM
jgi:hypothetical protein